MWKSIRLVALLAFQGAATAASAGSVIFTNLGSSDSFDLTEGRSFSGANSAQEFTPVYSFVATASGQLESIEIALSLGSISPQFEPQAEILLTNAVPYASTPSDPHVLPFSGAIQPGTTLGAWSISGTQSAGLVRVSGGSEINLSAGASYFIEVIPSGPTNGTWWQNATGSTGTAADCVGVLGCGFNADVLSGAFRVLGVSAVPEPSSFAMMVLGILGLLSLPKARELI